MTTHATIFATDPAAGTIIQPAAGCCSTAEQESCCEPADKAACCGEPTPAGDSGCGCR